MKDIEKYFHLGQADVQTVLDEWPLRHSNLHGMDHWRRVSRNAQWLLSLVVDEPPMYAKLLPYVKLFALFHDSKREHEGWCEHHGYYAARVFVGWKQRIGQALAENESSQLVAIGLDAVQTAMAVHTHLKPFPELNHVWTKSSIFDKIVGVCVDADRIDLRRLGIAPDPDLMMTGIGQSVARDGDFSGADTWTVT